MKPLKIIGLGIVTSILMVAIILILLILGAYDWSEAADMLSRALAIIGILVLTVLTIAGIMHLVTDK